MSNHEILLMIQLIRMEYGEFHSVVEISNLIKKEFKALIGLDRIHNLLYSCENYETESLKITHNIVEEKENIFA